MGEIKLDKLKKVCKEVNDMVDEEKVEGISKIRTVGNKKERMALQFIETVEEIGKIDEDLLSDDIVDVFNELPNKDELNEALAAADKDKKSTKGKSKGEKKDGEKKPKKKKEPIAKSRYGHQQKMKSGRLDDALYEGGTMEEIMKALDIPRTRFNSHVKHLRDDLGLTIKIKKDDGTDRTKDHYSVKEEKLVAE